MFDPKLYRNACDRLCLDAEKLEEIIAMTENTNTKRRLSRPMKTVLIIAACVAALTVTAMAAPVVQRLFTTYTITYRSSDSSTDFTVPSIQLEERDGRNILTVNDLETDVTDAFAQDGQYVMNVDGADITVKPDGQVEITMATGEDSGPITYTFNLRSDDDVSSVGVVSLDPDALEDVKMGSYSIVTDESGEVIIAASKPLLLSE